MEQPQATTTMEVRSRRSAALELATLLRGQAGVQTSTPVPIGLIAGWGRFPVVFAQKCQELGLPLVTVGITGHADPQLKRLSSEFHWAGVAQMGRMIRCLKRAGVRQAVMAGKIHKQIMYRPWRWLTLLPDWRTLRFWFRQPRRDNRDDTLLLGMIAEFKKDGIDFASALDLCPELLVEARVLTRRPPTASEEKDIAFGWRLAKEMGRLDVGQSVAVMEQAVLAVEAIEGTDQAILRAGLLCRAGGFTVVKVAKPQQDRRFDMPTVGPSTLGALHRAGGRVLAVEAGQTIILDEAETTALANRLGLTLVAYATPPA